MTREQLLFDYATNGEIQNTIIIQPGKFEGEPIYTPYFWDATIDGCAEELSFMEDGCGEYVALVEIGNEDRAQFPEIDQADKFAFLSENDQGSLRAG